MSWAASNKSLAYLASWEVEGCFAEGIERVEESVNLIVDVLGHGGVFKEVVEIHVMEPQTELLGSSKDAWTGVEKLRSRDFVVGVCHDGVGG